MKCETRGKAVLLVRAVVESVVGLFTLPLRKLLSNKQKAETHFQETELNRRILSQCPALSCYIPSPWAPGPISQTVFASLIPVQDVVYKRELVCMPDQVSVALDWGPVAHGTADDALIVLCLHGIACSSEGKSLKTMVQECTAKGWRGVVYNRRGHGRTSILPMDTTGDVAQAPTKSFPMHVDIDDMAAVVGHIHHQFPGAQVVGVGFSLGSNLLLRYLGVEKENSGLLAAVSIANGYDLVEGTKSLSHKYRIMDTMIASKLVQLLQTNSHHLLSTNKVKSDQLHAILRSRSVREFDEQLVKPLYGYTDVDEYYHDCSCASLLADIVVPTLCVSDVSDPLVDPELLKHPVDASRRNPFVISTFTRNGGHLGWFEGWKGKNWSIKATSQYISAIVDAQRDFTIARSEVDQCLAA